MPYRERRHCATGRKQAVRGISVQHPLGSRESCTPWRTLNSNHLYNAITVYRAGVRGILTVYGSPKHVMQWYVQGARSSLSSVDLVRRRAVLENKNALARIYYHRRQSVKRSFNPIY